MESNPNESARPNGVVLPPLGSNTPRLPRAPVTLPPEGPPAMSPRARRAARRLRIPLQALPIPAPGKRITERDVLAAARLDQTIPMTTAARRLAAERGVHAADLARKLGRRLNTADIAKLEAVPLRLPAERVKLFPEDVERIARGTQSVRDIPRIEMEAFLPAAALQRWNALPGAAGAYLVRAISVLLTEARFKPFRAVIDGDDIVYRGQINLRYVAHTGTAARSYLFQNAEKLPVELIQETLGGANVPFDASHASVLVSLRDVSQLPVESFRAELEPGEVAVVTLSSLQSRSMHDAERGEWAIQSGWKMYTAADARVIDPDLLGFFISRLKSFIANPSILV